MQFHHGPAGATLETKWLDFANSEQLRAALTEALHLGQLHRVRSWIGNNKQMRTIRLTDQEWMSQTWFPEFARLRVKRLAVVVSQDAPDSAGHSQHFAASQQPYPLRHAVFCR